MSRRQRLANCAYDEVHPTFKLIADRLPRDLAKAMRDDPSILDTMVRAGQARHKLAFNRYMQLEDQRTFWSKMNRDLQWGLNEDELVRVAGEALRDFKPEWNDVNIALIIVPRLPALDARMPGVKRTFLALCELASRNMARGMINSLDRDFDIKTCFYTNKRELTNGNPYRPGFTFEAIRWTKEVSDSSRRVTGVVVNNGDRPVDAGGLACAVLHPDWLRQYSCIEPVKLTGYGVNAVCLDDEDNIPVLTYYGDDDDDRIELVLHGRSNEIFADSRYSKT